MKHKNYLQEMFFDAHHYSLITGKQSGTAVHIRRYRKTKILIVQN